MDDFEGVVNTRTVYTNNPCPEKDINVVVANNENGTSSTDWVNGFPNGSNTNFWGIFFSGSYVGTGVSNGSGSGNDVPVLTQGEGFFNHLNAFLISVGSALVELGETIEDEVTNLWSWIRRIFRRGCDCPSRVSLRQVDNSLVLILNPEDPNLDTTTFDDLPCPELGNTNFAILIASDQNNNLSSVSLATHTWWNETATTIQKNALLNFLFIKGYTAKNFQFIDNLVQLSQTQNVNIDAIIKFVLTLNAQQYSWFTNQNDFNQHDFSAVNQIAIFVSNNTINNTISNTNLSFVNEMINYIITHPNVAVSQYINWFFNSNEGQDYFYDEDFWISTSLSFSQQDLPSWDSFYNAYPKNLDGSFMTGADNVYGYVGGSVWQARLDYPNVTKNTCALKVSIALNESGVVIPYIPNQTLEGSGIFAGKYFFVNAKALNQWMRLTFGTYPVPTNGITNNNHYNFTSAQEFTNDILINPKKGIYSLVYPDNYSVTGHADILLEDGTCAAGCNLNYTVSYIDVWVLD